MHAHMRTRTGMRTGTRFASGQGISLMPPPVHPRMGAEGTCNRSRRLHQSTMHSCARTAATTGAPQRGNQETCKAAH
eukprot:15376910-Alexandrium_andersonii.AAC.1